MVTLPQIPQQQANQQEFSAPPRTRVDPVSNRAARVTWAEPGKRFKEKQQRLCGENEHVV
jgi:hypothetical protein